MPIIGERLNRIFAERGQLQRQMEIRSNVELKNVEFKDLTLVDARKKGLSFAFAFTTKYGEKGGKIEIEGEIFYMDKEEEMQKIAESWKKDKNLPDNLRLTVLNRALEVSYLEAIALADHIRLPLPLQLPRFVKKK